MLTQSVQRPLLPDRRPMRHAPLRFATWMMESMSKYAPTGDLPAPTWNAWSALYLHNFQFSDGGRPVSIIEPPISTDRGGGGGTLPHTDTYVYTHIYTPTNTPTHAHRCCVNRSSWEKMPSVLMPSSVPARMIRVAISPRFCVLFCVKVRFSIYRRSVGRAATTLLPQATQPTKPTTTKPHPPRPSAS